MSSSVHLEKNHQFHIVNPSPLPIIASFAAFILFVGAVLFIKNKAPGSYIFYTGLSMVFGTMFFWWRDVIKEARVDKSHTSPVRQGLRIGMTLFILSEVMFFFAFFWSVLQGVANPAGILEDGNSFAVGLMSYPPSNVTTLDPFDVPLLNTLILLLSGTTVTWAHHCLYNNDQKNMARALLITVILGMSFTALQVAEYSSALKFHFGFKTGLYASNFYMSTGFHGLHVIIGTIFLFICYLRAKKGQFSAENHLGFEFAAWYWHFVDVVWLLLFACVYIIGR